MSHRRKILIVTGIVLGVAILIPVVRHYQLRFAVANYVAELKAKGEPMDLAQVIPPPVPPEENGTPIFLKAVSLLDTNYGVLGSNSPSAMRMIAPGKAIIGWTQPDVQSDYGSGKKSWGEIEAALAEDGEGLKLLRQITGHPALDFDLVYSNGADKIQIPYLASEKKSAQRLSAAAIDDLHRGDAASAVKNVRAMLALANGMSHDRVIISELVRIAIAQMTLPASWELLQSANVTDEQLADLQRDWAGLEFFHGEENALAMERVMEETIIVKWRSSNSELQNYFGRWEKFGGPDYKETAFDKFKIKAKIFLWRYWWSYSDEIRKLKGYQVLLGTARSAGTNYSLLAAQREQEDKLQGLLTTTNDGNSVWFGNPEKIDMHSMLSAGLLNLNPVFSKVFRAEAAKQVTVTAIALKRYQLKHGNYPADLNSLVPEFLSTIPPDPADGQPLRYRPNADGTFLLYSVGENGVDDGGNPALEKNVEGSNYYWQNPHALDWVWPQPATEAEIQAYYKKLSSKSN